MNGMEQPQPRRTHIKVRCVCCGSHQWHHPERETVGSECVILLAQLICCRQQSPLYSNKVQENYKIQSHPDEPLLSSQLFAAICDHQAENTYTGEWK
jgi:hypothetical protein